MFKLEIDTDNAAFEGVPYKEVARILQETALKLMQGYDGGKCRDTNGNTVGAWELKL